MLRVLGTIQNSQYAKSMKNQAKDLISWVSEIHDGIYPHLVSIPSTESWKVPTSLRAF